MKRILFLLLTISLLSCSNDDDNVNNAYSDFLAQRLPQYTATIDNEPINWKHGVNDYQISVSATGSPGDLNRSLIFRLENMNNWDQIVITTPAYDTSSEVEFNKVFGVGMKKIGNASDEYHITIRNNYENYQVCNSDAGYTIEVLKTEELVSDYYNPVLKVWFKIDNIELNKCNPDNNKILNNGLVLAHFMGYKSL